LEPLVLQPAACGQAADGGGAATKNEYDVAPLLGELNAKACVRTEPARVTIEGVEKQIEDSLIGQY